MKLKVGDNVFIFLVAVESRGNFLMFFVPCRTTH